MNSLFSTALLSARGSNRIHKLADKFSEQTRSLFMAKACFNGFLFNLKNDNRNDKAGCNHRTTTDINKSMGTCRYSTESIIKPSNLKKPDEPLDPTRKPTLEQLLILKEKIIKHVCFNQFNLFDFNKTKYLPLIFLIAAKMS